MTWRLRGWPGVSRGTWHPPLVGATRASPALPARAPPGPHHRCEGCPCGGPSDGKKTREPDMAVRAELERAGTVSSADAIRPGQAGWHHGSYSPRGCDVAPANVDLNRA